MPYNGGLKEEAMLRLFPCSGGGRRRPRWRRRVGRNKEAGGARWAKRPIGPEAKNPFEIKIGLLNLPRLCKFVQGDLGGILTQGSFLNSSRILKDF
jgi:hypothetical protein